MGETLRILLLGECRELIASPLEHTVISWESSGTRGSLHQEIGPADVAILELRGDQPDRLSMLRYLRKVSPNLPVLLLAEPDALEQLHEALSQGPEEILIRAGDPERMEPLLTHHIEKLMQRRYLSRRLHESERRFWSFFDHAPMGLVLLGPGEGIEHANSAFLEFAGRHLEELRAMPFQSLLSEEDRPIWVGLCEDLRQGEQHFARITQEFEHRDGTRRVGECVFLVQRDEEEDITFCLGMIADATEKRRIQENLRHADRMYSLGQVAGGVAHDFNNLLTIVKSHCFLMGDSLDSPDKLQWSLERIDTAANRASKLTRQLLNIGRRNGVSSSNLSPNERLRDMQVVLESLFGKTVRVEMSLQEDLRAIGLDQARFEQLVMNLAINARDAMEGGGRFAVRTFNVEHRGARSDLPQSLPRGEYTVVEVEDTGAGMDEEVRERAFEPFFTTKEVGSGTGLGLATVLSVVKEASGVIDLDSQPGRGTRIRIYLPSLEQRTDTPPKLRRVRQGTPHIGSETILLVEDEEALRHPIRRILESRGYNVIEAGSADDALFASREFGGTIHLLLSDVMMPGTDGAALARIVKRERPETEILLMSGYTAEVLQLEPKVPYRILQKPFPFELLGRTIRQLLNHRARV